MNKPGCGKEQRAGNGEGAASFYADNPEALSVRATSLMRGGERYTVSPSRAGDLKQKSPSAIAGAL